MRTRIWLTVILLVFLPVLLNAQVVRSLGLKFGGAKTNQTWNYSDPLFSLLPDFESRLGLDIAVFLEAFHHPFARMLVEAHYIQKGFTDHIPVTTPENPDGTGEFLEFKPRVDYLSFPVLAKFNVPAFVSPFLIAGPRFDIRIGQKAEGYGAVYDQLKRFDVGATFGFGLEMSELTSFSLLAEIRYSPSFTKIFENDNLTVENRSVEVLVGLGF